MNLDSITISNFRVFDQFEFKFPKTPGVFLFAGSNVDRPELGSNGVGKSSLWDAVAFILYGESTRRLKGGELVRDGEDTITGTLTTDIGTIQRVWSTKRKQSLQLNGKEISQAELTTALGLDREMFVTTTIVPQAEPLFVDLPPASQVSILQRLLGVERWLTYANTAAARATPLERVIATMTGQHAGLTLALKSTAIAALEAEVSDWADKQVTAIEALRLEVARLEGVVDNLPSLIGIQAELAANNTIAQRATHNVGVLDRRTRELVAAIAREEAALASLTVQANTVKKRVNFFDATPKCPTCDQSITQQHKVACLTVLRDEVGRLHGQAAAITQRCETYRDEAKQIEAQLTAAKSRLRGAEAASGALQREIAVGESQRSSAKTAVQNARNRLRQLEEQTNPHAAALERARKERAETEAQCVKLEEQIAADTTRLESLRVWVRGFKTIRSQLIAEALNQFGLEIAAVLDDLGLVGWQVVPEIDPSVFESAKIQTGFRFAVTDPNGEKRAIEAYSGGETTRIRLAVQLGLGALVADVAGTTNGFEIWDECSNFLSTEGVLGLYTSLYNRAQRLRRPIFIVDHHPAEFADFAGVYTLVRENNKVRLQ